MLNLLVALLLCFQEQEPQYPANQGAINDFANILSEEDKTKLRNQCAALRDSGGAMVVVVTTPSLYGLDVADYANQLFKKWGIGSKKEDNGVLLLIAPNERKARIEVGYGNESRLTDLEAKAIISDVIRPLFREGKISASVVAGTEAILKKLGNPVEAAPAAPASSGSSGVGDVIKMVLIIIGAILLIWFLAWSGLGEALLMVMASLPPPSRGSGGGGWSSGSSSSGSSRSESSSSRGGSSGGGGASGDL